MSNRPDTFFLDFNGIQFAQPALLCKELREADTIYWFADFMDKVDAEVIEEVLKKLKSRKQKLFIHGTIKGRSFFQSPSLSIVDHKALTKRHHWDPSD